MICTCNNLEYQEGFLYPSRCHLNVTDDCNLQCRYCFVEQHPHYMSLETAKTVADWLYDNYTNHKFFTNEKCNIYFFGGEPMLCYDSIIKPIIEYCNKKYPNQFDFGMTTNGTLLTKEKIDFLKENNFSLLLSMDGTPKTQNYNRPCKNHNLKSFELLEKNIPYILQIFPNIEVRSTIFADTVQNFFEDYLYIESLGIKKWIGEVDTFHEEQWTEEKKAILTEQMNNMFCYRLQQLSNNILPMQSLNIDAALLEHKRLLENLIIPDKLIIPNKFYKSVCGLGISSVAIGYNGNIYSCQDEVSTQNEYFKIGNIFQKEKIDLKKHKELVNKYIDAINNLTLDNSKCNECSLKPLCAHNQGCLCVSYAYNKNLTSIPEIQCFIRQLIFKNSIIILSCLAEIDNEAVNQYLNQDFPNFPMYNDKL